LTRYRTLFSLALLLLLLLLLLPKICISLFRNIEYSHQELNISNVA
jgi:hypothetical protein